MISKENVLFSVVGVLLGFIVGFVFANTVNRGGVGAQGPAAMQAQQVAGLPAGHPPVDPSAMQPQVDPKLLADAARVADASPANFDAQVKAAEIHYQAHEYHGAVKFYERANELRPEDYEVLVALGNVQFDDAHFEDAERWYAAALARRPDDVNVRTDMGLTFMFREPADLARAVAEFKRSLELKPQHVQTLQNLTVAYTRQNDARSAEATLAKLEKVNPQSPALERLRAEIAKLGDAGTAPAANVPASAAKK